MNRLTAASVPLLLALLLATVGRAAEPVAGSPVAGALATTSTATSTAAEPAVPADGFPLVLAEAGSNQLTLTTVEPGTWEVRTTGGDPYVLTVPAGAPYDVAATPVLSYEYRSASELDDLAVYAGPRWSEQRSLHIARTSPQAEWTPLTFDLSRDAEILADHPTRWRLDLGDRPGLVLQVRNIRLRPRSPIEAAAVAVAGRRIAAAQAADQALAAYLADAHPARLTKVTAGDDSITVTGRLPVESAGDLLLAEWPAWQPLAATMHFASTWPLAERRFKTEVPRRAEDGRDRLLSRFVVVRRDAAGDTPLSRGRWADVVPAATAPPPAVPANRKGLAAYRDDPLQTSDVDALGLGSVVVNITLDTLFQEGPGPGAEAVSDGRRTWYLRPQAFASFDRSVQAAAERKLVVLGAVLVRPARAWKATTLGTLLQHPDYDPAGLYAMPNLTSPDGVAAYVMAIDLLARRYARADATHGRIHRWVLFNELDDSWTWTNCGRQPPLVFIDHYHRALRLADLVLRRQDPDAQVLVSLTHNWTTSQAPNPTSREVLERLLAFSKAEGDFPWGLAFHPYPSGPRAWEDADAQFTFDTPRITFRNIEVLDAWMKRPAARYRGKTVRDVWLTEQGANSVDYASATLAQQAASLAYVWKKLEPLTAIRGFAYHNWRDDRAENGLRLGLRRFPDDEEKPNGTKPIYDVYRALETAEEDKAIAFALPLIGVSDWAAVQHREAIVDPSAPAATKDEDDEDTKPADATDAAPAPKKKSRGGKPLPGQ